MNQYDIDRLYELTPREQYAADFVVSNLPLARELVSNYYITKAKVHVVFILMNVLAFVLFAIYFAVLWIFDLTIPETDQAVSNITHWFITISLFLMAMEFSWWVLRGIGRGISNLFSPSRH